MKYRCWFVGFQPFISHTCQESLYKVIYTLYLTHHQNGEGIFSCLLFTDVCRASFCENNVGKSVHSQILGMFQVGANKQVGLHVFEMGPKFTSKREKMCMLSFHITHNELLVEIIDKKYFYNFIKKSFENVEVVFSFYTSMG